MRTYSELIALPTFKDRYEYLRLKGEVGIDTFGWDRYINQRFYRSHQWLRLRNEIIVRDHGCDMAMHGHEIQNRILIHHMNPIEAKDIVNATDILMNPEYLICVSHDTHNAIHYGIEYQDSYIPVERNQNDTCPWRVSK